MQSSAWALQEYIVVLLVKAGRDDPCPPGSMRVLPMKILKEENILIDLELNATTP